MALARIPGEIICIVNHLFCRGVGQYDAVLFPTSLLACTLFCRNIRRDHKEDSFDKDRQVREHVFSLKYVPVNASMTGGQI